VFAAVCLGAMVLPQTAGAVLSGENGRIVFVQGPTSGNAQLFLLPVPGSTGGGTLSPPITSDAVQHRHPTWSPDRTKIAYAAGSPGCTPNKCDIFVLDLTTPGAVPQNITNSATVNEDRPAWSPDGTRIAYESEVTSGSGQLDVIVDSVPFGSGTNLNLTSSTTIEGKPAWSPDSQTLFYGLGNVNVMPNGSNNDTKIEREPADNTGGPTEVVHISGAHAFQPSISPDGTRICYTETGTAGLNTSAAIFVAPLSDANNATVLAADGAGDYNCTWSPDGFFVAYVSGIFTSGVLVMELADNTSVLPVELSQDEGANDFDGNPDWAPDARPECPDSTVTTPPNVPVTFQAVCTDTGPAYEQTDVLEFNDTSPTHGTLTQELAGDPFTYTPDSGFVGTDSFQVKSFDALGFGSDTGTVTLRVQVPGSTTQATNNKKKCKKKKHKRSAESAKKKKCKKKKK
jgi:Tol biopolymer transport system component